MNIIKNAKHRIAVIIYINDDSNEFLENEIIEMGRVFDVYLIINKKSNINPLKYSLLLPVNGYECDKFKSQYDTRITYSVLKYLLKVVNYYERFLILYKNNGDKNYINSIKSKTIDIFSSPITKSILNSDKIDHEFRKSLYKSDSKLNIFNKISLSGVNITNVLKNGEVLLNKYDLSKICSYIGSDNNYLETFDLFSSIYFIPSILEKLEIDYMNCDLLGIEV